MTCSKFLRAAAALAWLALPQAGWPAFDPVNDDTDIFLANPAFTSTRPNVLIVVDNSANWGQNTGLASPWNTKYNGVKNALVAIAQDSTIINSNYNVGLALWAESGGDNNTTGGGYLRYGIRQMSGDPADVTSNRGRFVQLVNALDKSTGTGDGTNNTDYSLGMYEFFQYFAGLSSFAGHGKVKTDAGDRVYVTGLGRQPLAGSPLPSGAEAKTSAAMPYTSPIVDGCQKNFLIVISNGNATDPNSELTDAQSKLAGVTGTATPSQIPLTPVFEQGVWSDEFAKFMANSDCNATFAGVQNVITYTIDVIPDATGHGPDHTAMLKSMAINGKGKYYAVTDTSSTGQLTGFLKNIFQEVQAVNSVFASTTLPVSVNVRGTNLNQVYIGVFRPDPNKAPRWLGNLKLYKLGVDTATQSLFLADATGGPAENAATGFISGNATSYWTESSNFWSFRDPLVNGVGGPSDKQDGDLVEKGGAAQEIRIRYASSQAARNVYTCTGSAPGGLCAGSDALSLTPFNSTNATAADLGAYLTYQVSSLTWDSITKKATAVLASPVFDAAFTPRWSAVEPGLSKVRIAGADPRIFNGDYPIVQVPATTNTFTFDLDPGPDSTRARVRMVNDHLLAIGDYVYVSSWDPVTGLYTGFSTYYCDIFGNCTLPYVKPITRIDAKTFDYTLSAPESSPAANYYVYGLKLLTSVRGIKGDNSVYVNIPNHGFGAPGTVVSSFGYLWDEDFDYEWYFGYDTPTVQDANTIKISSYWYTSYLLTIGATLPWGSGPNPPVVNTAIATAVGWTAGGWTGLGRNLSIFNSSAGYNGVRAVTAAGALNGLGASQFTFASAIDAGPITTATNPNMRVGYSIASITRGSGSTQNNATVVLTLPAGETTHGLAAGGGSTINIFGTGGAFAAGNCGGTKVCGYDKAWVIQSITATGFVITDPDIKNVVLASPLTSTVNPNMIAGFSVTDIRPAITATASYASNKPIYLWRYFAPGYGPTVASIAPLGSASGAITAGRIGDTDTATANNIVLWTRGQDNVSPGENLDCTIAPYYPCVPVTNAVPRLTDIRASAHGDVLHSRPATINYNRLLTLVTGTDDDSMTVRDSDVYAFYGSNDGMLRAVKGGILQRTPKPPNGLTGPTLPVTVGPDAGVAAGTERWSFVPKEFFPKLKRLRNQTPTISNLDQKDYFFDGSIGVYQKDVKGNGLAATPLNCDPADTVGCSGATVSGVLGDNIDPIKGDKVHIYLSLRRGGNFIYALDVLNPAAPKLLWRKGNGDAGWDQVGQTWSEPKIARVAANLGNANNPDNVVLIFGAGYNDEVEDINPCLLESWSTTQVVQKPIGAGTVTYTAAGSCTISGAGSATAKTFSRASGPNGTGRGLLIVDAFSGNVVWQASAAVTTSSTGLPAGSLRKLRVAGMTCAIPSDLTVLDKNRDGLADRLYTGDTCGNVWRADITDSNADNWKVTQIAELSGSGATTITNKLKFLFPPDLVFGTDGLGNYTAVLLGSGDREHPFDATVQNAFYMIKDRNDADPISGAPNNTTVSIGAPTPPPPPPPPALPVSPTLQSKMFDATDVNVDNGVPSSEKGWFVSLRAGEKVVGSAVTIAGTTFFNTNQPSSTAGGGACSSNLGVAREYLVGFADAAATVDLQGLGTLSIANRSTIHAGGGYLPSPVPVVVEIDGKKYQAVISGTSVQTPPGLTLEKRTRAFWYKQID